MRALHKSLAIAKEIVKGLLIGATALAVVYVTLICCYSLVHVIYYSSMPVKMLVTAGVIVVATLVDLVIKEPKS